MWTIVFFFKDAKAIRLEKFSTNDARIIEYSDGKNI